MKVSPLVPIASMLLVRVRVGVLTLTLTLTLALALALALTLTLTLTVEAHLPPQNGAVVLGEAQQGGAVPERYGRHREI